MAGLMMTRRLPALLALPGMAAAIALVVGIAAHLPWSSPPTSAPDSESLRHLLFDTVLTQGASRLSGAMMYTVFGAIFSQVVMRQGIAARFVRVAAEFAGERKLLLAGGLTAAVSVSFASLTGVGSVIMVGNLTLPILMGAGLSAEFSACLLLFGIALGGIYNPANMGFYKEVLKLDTAYVSRFAAVYGGLMALTTLAFLLIEGRRERGRYAWAVQVEDRRPQVPLPALLTPLLPIGLILLPGLALGPLSLPGQPWPIIPAFIAGILYGCLTTRPAQLIGDLTACVLEGLKDVGPVLGLFMGIGMTLNAMMDPLTGKVMQGVIASLVPRGPLGFVLFFTLLAPLTLYRGPLNMYGLGAGFAALMLASGLMPPAAVMAGFLAVGQVQGVSDPTNTANVWIAQFTQGSTQGYLKRTLPYVWVFVLLALLYATLVRGVLS
jgi:C4-dicarboxylate transporter, DcuC family